MVYIVFLTHERTLHFLTHNMYVAYRIVTLLNSNSRNSVNLLAFYSNVTLFSANLEFHIC
jgi:hypothetical protein